MKLSVITPVLNEIFFLPLFLQAVFSFALELCVLDGGSCDGTYEVLLEQKKKYPGLRVWQSRQEGLPYSPDWKEGERRQFLLEQARGEWVLALDCDEFMDDRFKSFLPRLTGDKRYDLYEFRYLPFWRDMNTLRLSTAQDPHWLGYICRMGRREGLSYSKSSHHCHLLYQEKPLWEHSRRLRLPHLNLFHYHYALGPRIKYNDNRRGDVNLLAPGGEPDWDYEPPDYPIKTVPFTGSHPQVINDYLEGKMPI